MKNYTQFIVMFEKTEVDYNAVGHVTKHAITASNKEHLGVIMERVREITQSENPAITIVRDELEPIQ